MSPPSADMTEMSKRRVVVLFDARSILVAAAVLLGLAVTVKLLLLAQAGLTLIAIAQKARRVPRAPNDVARRRAAP
jgi:hypothetical protein